MSLINTTHIGVLRNQDAIAKISNITADLIRQMDSVNHNHEDAVINIFHYLDKSSIFSTHLRVLDTITAELPNEILLLNQAWRSISNNRMDASIKPPHILKAFVTDISPMLPIGLGLTFPLTTNG